MRYVWMCSGLFSSSAKGASASRASAYLGLSTSTSKERSDWTISGLVGSNVRAGVPVLGAFGVFAIFGGIITVGLVALKSLFRGEHPMLSGFVGRGQGEVSQTDDLLHEKCAVTLR